MVTCCVWAASIRPVVLDPLPILHPVYPVPSLDRSNAHRSRPSDLVTSSSTVRDDTTNASFPLTTRSEPNPPLTPLSASPQRPVIVEH
ncbi:hypothetical protein DB88DRAFT_151934 [Papiliotrema laurentii]|uniref:Uncharacterized protein n=1 Tax=Papiliotrema laurentii TaxID=5418 RepID=A0AAD9L7H1_PAPLA|nr:hypothetical protein DB88DRAFT_151934 [Papiliotrema laurentii]